MVLILPGILRNLGRRRLEVWCGSLWTRNEKGVQGTLKITAVRDDGTGRECRGGLLLQRGCGGVGFLITEEEVFGVL